MANRAYLYSTDDPDAWEPYPEADYYDSRWVIPLAWFFFYQPGDLTRVPVSYLNSTWNEVKFRADKQVAVDVFRSRRLLLSAVIDGRVSEQRVDTFLETVRGRPGRFLLLDPESVLGGMDPDDELHAARFSRIVALLDSSIATPEAVLAEVSPYVGWFSDDPDKVLGQILGYTYRTDG